MQFVPVANATRLVAPSRLFARLREDLAPFAYEIPAAFSSHIEILKTAGARDTPSATDLLNILKVRDLHINISEISCEVGVIAFIGSSGSNGCAFAKQDMSSVSDPLELLVWSSLIIRDMFCLFIVEKSDWSVLWQLSSITDIQHKGRSSCNIDLSHKHKTTAPYSNIWENKMLSAKRRMWRGVTGMPS